MSRFSECNNILYVEPRYYLKQIRRQLKYGKIHPNNFRQDLYKKRLSKAKNNLHIYHSPLYIPISGRFPLDKLTLFLWKKVLQKSLNELNIKNPIIWLSRPEMVDLIGGFNEKIVIYHIVDEYLAYSNVDKDKRISLEKCEHRMLKKADLVFVVSENLYKNKKKYNKNTYEVKNATDFEAYSQVITNDHRCSDDIKVLPRPIIGYSGLISERLDLDLINYIAQAHPEWSITLVGQVNDRNCSKKINSLEKFKNIYFLGRKKITQIPNYVKAFDVGIIPYEINEQSKNISPLKLYDYLAAGIPTVISDLPAAYEFNEVIYIADSKEKFNIHIENALASDNKELFLKRKNLASKNTWDERVKQISHLITKQLKF